VVMSVYLRIMRFLWKVAVDRARYQSTIVQVIGEL
jgi:hypothetical protein